MDYQTDTLLNQKINDNLALLIEVCGGVYSQIQLTDSNVLWTSSSINSPSYSCSTTHNIHEKILKQPHHIELFDVTEQQRTFNEQPIEYYIGTPLITNNGDIIGSLYVIGICEKVLSTQQLSIFKAISQGITADLSLVITEHQLVLERENIKRLNNEFDEFFHFASHDLKSPLNAIKNITSWIEEDLETDASNLDNSYFPLMNNSISRMKRLLNGLSCYSKIGKNDDDPTTLSLSNVVNDCCNELAIPDNFNVTVKDIELELPQIPLHFILSHLISNAVNHHPSTAGNIHINGELTNNTYRISVNDDGSGIEQRYHEKIFKPFTTLKSKDVLEVNGLGLSMIKKALSPYSGRVIIESEIEIGSTFTIFWPRK